MYVHYTAISVTGQYKYDEETLQNTNRVTQGTKGGNDPILKGINFSET